MLFYSRPDALLTAATPASELTRLPKCEIVAFVVRNVGFMEGARRFGLDQAERYHPQLAAVFDLLAENPLIARERSDINPPVRVHPFQAHLIVYALDEGGEVFVIRVRHGHEDWLSDPEVW